MTYQHIRVEPLSTALGAEIGGVDLGAPLGEPVLAEIRHAFGEYGVVFFRDQRLTPEQHVAFARHFGGIEVNRFFAALPGYPMIAEVRKEPDQRQNIGNGWHTDHSYDLAPAMGSMLYAREVPATGGDTLFASMYAAYDALSDGLKATLESLRALHSSRHVFGAEAHARRGDLKGRIGNPELATQDAVHPVVIRHPETGRKALFVNRASPCALRAGPRRNHGHCWNISTDTRSGPNSRSAFIGAPARWLSGITGRPGTSRSTTTTASAVSCIGSRSKARR
jgi:taurine dioxygenase